MTLHTMIVRESLTACASNLREWALTWLEVNDDKAIEHVDAAHEAAQQRHAEERRDEGAAA